MYRFSVKGVVQGVGFRPFVYRECVRAGLKGYVKNVGSGVEVVVDDKEGLLRILEAPPPLARIDSVDIVKVDGEFGDFSIFESGGEGYAEVPPDLFLCGDCLKELRSKDDRRRDYYFITCTNCGPRYSITRQNPYDRHTTTMGDYQMCGKCSKEYKNPLDRRYHAQTIACRDCGPRLRLAIGGKRIAGSEDELISEAAGLLGDGQVVAIKGVGGFHLACNLKRKALERLREYTGRRDKPYAVMCADMGMVKSIASPTRHEKALLESYQRPIVLAKKKKALRGVTELDTVGIMLPYTALHYLLLALVGQPLLMTSSNLPDEPLTYEDSHQFVENILSHERAIENPVDDSVVKAVVGKALFIRRSRGYVPQSIRMPVERDVQLLALGAELNNTFCVYGKGRATPSPHVGMTSNPRTLERMRDSARRFLGFTGVDPDAVLVDLHPGYESAAYGIELAEELEVPLIKVQHHLAHAYSVAAERGLDDFTAIVCDGLGYGPDGTVWGGEVFAGNERVGHLQPHRMLGGDSATTHPAKMLYSILSEFMESEEAGRHLKGGFGKRELKALGAQLREGFNCPETTSCGRVLDAASYLLGFCDVRTYDGRPAMLLEANSTRPYRLEPVIEDNVLMTTPLFNYLTDNKEKDRGRLAATVQAYLAEGLLEIASGFGGEKVFSGGCAYNRTMTSIMVEKGVYLNEKVPCGDGGISFGQIAHYLANPGDDVA